MNVKKKKGFVSIKTISAFLLLVAVVCVSTTLFVNESEDVEGADATTELFGIKYTKKDGSNVAMVTGYTEDILKISYIPEIVVIEDTPYKVTSIFREAFLNCTELESITLPANLRSIEENAFEGCTNLKTVTIIDTDAEPSQLKIMKEYAFSRCEALTSITIPSSVITIDDRVFNNCTMLKTVTIIDKDDDRSNLASINTNVFYDCKALTSITIPSSVVGIYDSAFYNCTMLKTVTITDTDGNTSNLGVVANNAFYNCQALTSITIPSGVKAIGENAFYDCKALTTVTITDTESNRSVLETIYQYAFKNCQALKSITIPANVTSIGKEAFNGCSALATVTITDTDTDPSKLGSIGEGVFKLCKALESITIPSSVTSIGKEAFNGCSVLATVTITDTDTNPSKLGSIGEGGFGLCKALASITIPSSVTSIGKKAFNGCSVLATVTVTDTDTNPSKLGSIGESTFELCIALESINIPSSVTSIDRRAFNSCSALATVTITDTDTNPSKLGSIGDSVFGLCKALESINIPSNVTSIGKWAFNNCEALTSITIPSNVTSIGDTAFENCKALEFITIPNGVTSIGNHAFGSCFYLKTVTISGKGAGGGDILGKYFSGSQWKLPSSLPITTLIIDTTDEIDIDDVNIIYDNALKITKQSTNVIGAKDKVIFNTIVVEKEDRAGDPYNAYIGKDGLWVGGTTDVTVTIIADPVEGGTYTGDGVYEFTDTVDLTATPNKGYVFVKWVNGSGEETSDNPYSFRAKEDIELTAIFEIIPITLYVKADPSNYGETTGSGTYDYGTIVKITVTPNNGYKFVAWSDGITDAERSLKLTADTSLTAYFVEDDPDMCTITVVIKGNGNVYGMGTFAKGTVITLNASPDQGYSFQGWSHTPYAGQTIQLSVESDMVITATFSQNDTGIGGSNTTIDTTTVVIIIVVIIVIFGIIVAVSLIRGRGSV